MPLPNARFAEVPVAKLLTYLLDPNHAKGRHKARMLAAIGFDQHHIGALRAEIRRIAEEGRATLDSHTPFGVKWRAWGEIRGPNGRTLGVRTVWIVPSGGLVPHFVTLVPARRMPSEELQP